MRRTRATPRARRGFTLIELVLALGLFSLLLVALLRLLDTSMNLWSAVDERRDAVEAGEALGGLLTRDLATLEAGPEGDLLVDWALVDMDGDQVAGLPVARLRFVRRASAAELARLAAWDEEPEGAAVLAVDEVPGDWDRVRRALVEVVWVLVPAPDPRPAGSSEPARLVGRLLRGERRLDDAARPSLFDPRFLGASGRPPAGSCEELAEGVLWFDLALATQTTITDPALSAYGRDLARNQGASKPPLPPWEEEGREDRRWGVGDGLADGASAWDAWGLGRPDPEVSPRNHAGAGMPTAGDVPLLPRRLRVTLEVQPEARVGLRPKLVGAIDHLETVFSVTDGRRMPEPGAHLLVGEEWLRLESTSGDRVTVQRGQRGSQPQPHRGGELLQFGRVIEREVVVDLAREDWDL